MSSDVRSLAAAWVKQQHPRHAAKVLQSTFGLEERTAKRVLAGEASQATLEAMARAWGRPFIEFVFQHHMAPPAIAPHRTWWITEEGVREAPGGHALHVRDALGLVETRDLKAYAITNLGWIAATTSSAGVELEHGNAVDPVALGHAALFVTRHPGPVRINGALVVDAEAALHRHSMRSAARDLAALRSPTWSIERRPLEAVQAPKLVGLLRAVHARGDAPGTLPRILLDHQLLPTSSLIHVKGEAMRSLWTGDRLGVNPTETMGRDLRDRDDQRYAGLIRAHVLQAFDGPTFHELRISIDGQPQHYRRVAVAEKPAADGSRLVATSVERIAA